MSANDHIADRELLARTRTGEAEAFGAFYRAHHGDVLAYLRVRVRDTELATDLMCEAFARALAAVHDEQRELPLVPIAWLVTIARNTLIDSLRQRPRSGRRAVLVPAQRSGRRLAAAGGRSPVRLEGDASARSAGRAPGVVPAVSGCQPTIAQVDAAGRIELIQFETSAAGASTGRSTVTNAATATLTTSGSGSSSSSAAPGSTAISRAKQSASARANRRLQALACSPDAEPADGCE